MNSKTIMFIKKICQLVWGNYIALFILIWCVLGLLINNSDQESYSLQHAGVEAVVERHTFTLGGSEVARFNNVGDSFEFQGKLLPAKQPGQFVIGAVAYQILNLIGFTYVEDYKYTAALVTWGSATALTALAFVALFHLLFRVWSYPFSNSFITCFALFFGTILLPYSGVLHHDLIVANLIIFIFYCIERCLSKQYTHSKYLALVGGGFAGIAIFVSMLGSIIVACLCFYALIRLHPKLKFFFLVGCIFGLVPLAIYNYYYFGNPLLQANIAGNYQDTFFQFELERFRRHIDDYLLLGVISINKYSPIASIGLLGLIFLNRHRKQAILISLTTFLHIFYILNIETIGHCQYGPRYLIPLMPFLSLGILGLFHKLSRFFLINTIYLLPVSLILAYSFVVNLFGALTGTMYCGIWEFAFPKYLSTFSISTIKSLPLLSLSIFVFIVYIVLGNFFASKKWLLNNSFFYRISSDFTAQDLIDRDYQVRWRNFIIKFLALLLVFFIYYFANPHKVSPYDYTIRIAEAFLNGKVGLVSAPTSYLNELVWSEGLYYSVFPLGSVLTMLPLALLKQFHLVDHIPTAIIVALIACTITIFIFKIISQYKVRISDSIFIVLAFMVGTFILPNLAFGGSWHLALGFAVIGQLGAIYYSIFRKKPLISGLYFSLAFGNRTEIILLAPIFLYFLCFVDPSDKNEYVRNKIQILLRFILPCFILGTLTLIYNYHRFDSLFDFGYARIPGVLDEPWYRYGIFSIYYVAHNFDHMILQLWLLVDSFPYIRPSGFGGSIFISSPFLLYIFSAHRIHRSIQICAWCSILILTSVLFCHGNAGGWQFSYRYAIELLPWTLLLLLEVTQGRCSILLKSLMLLSLLITLYGTWIFLWGA